MVDVFTARWKRDRFFSVWKREKNLMGYNFSKDQNKMVFYYSDGTIKEVANWSGCHFKLGKDFVEWKKRNTKND